MASSSRGVQQDSFIDDDDLTCPLCVEEFDLSDRNFRPCPCGYQVCQFCFNNIKNNMNGLCPACRRPYDEKTIEWKVVTQEEIAQFKANVQKNAKKKAEQRHKEAQKREVESLNRKHLAGLRVVQKNLVYVVGLSPGIPEQDLLQTLRGDKYFGQYGKIVKIVVSKAKQGDANQSLGVYVTFARKEDAAKCIAAVNGSQNGDRILRAQLGTTKYCSAYLRNEVCTNKQCMFLHEPGDNDDSYSRQDLSTINSVNTQRPLPVSTHTNGPAAQAARQVAQAQAPIQQAQPVAAAAPPMDRSQSKDESDHGDGSALPSSASWAKGGQQLSRRGSLATSAAASSPAISVALPASVQEEVSHQDSRSESVSEVAPASPMQTAPPQQPARPKDPILADILKAISYLSTLKDSAPKDTAERTRKYLPLFDDNGGRKRRAIREQQEAARLQLAQEMEQSTAAASETAEEQEPASGSGQLGGEPEDRVESRQGSTPGLLDDRRRSSSQLPIHRASQDNAVFGGAQAISPNPTTNGLTVNGRALTPLQQQQLLLLKSSQPQSASFIPDYPPGIGDIASQSNLMQPGHNRQASRYNFANDAAKVGAGSNQQSPMLGLPSNQFYGTTVAGPPPGLKSTGTPPNAMFGQSQFGAPGFGGVRKENSNEILQMLRSGGNSEAAKRGSGLVDLAEPTLLQARMQSQQQSSTGAGQGLFGGGQTQEDPLLPLDEDATFSVDALVADSVSDQAPSGAFSQEFMMPIPTSRSGTPSIPPGFGLPHAHPSVSREDPIGKPSPRLPSVPAPQGPQFTPPRMPATAHIPRVATPLSTVSVPPTPTPVPAVVVPKPNVAKLPAKEQAKEDVKTLASNTGLSKTIASQAAQIFAPVIQEEDFPALGKEPVKEKATPPVPKATTAAKDKKEKKEKGKSKDTAPPKEPEPETAKDTASKDTASKVTPAPAIVPVAAAKPAKKTPGILNITLPIPRESSSKISSKDAASKASPVSAPVAVESSAFPPLPPSTPAGTSTPTTAKGPKTLRVLPTPKAESPTAAVTPLSAVASNVATRPSSRQPSVVSISRSERPETPASEGISDTVSHTSASRASSPHATSRIGSAPVRTTTKSQQKKARKEALKKDASEIEATAVAEHEHVEEIGPILGRKKKQKKTKPTSVTATSTPAASRPPSPKPTSKVENSEVKAAPEETAKKAPSPEPKASPKAGKAKDKPKDTATDNTVLEVAIPEVDHDEMETEKPIPTPSAVLHDLLSHGEIPEPDKLAVFKTPASLHQRTQDLKNPADSQDVMEKLVITEEDRAALLSGRPVHKVAQGSHRIMLTPNGDCVRNLTPAEEERYLELQRRIYEEAGPTAFLPSRYNANNGFTLISHRAVPNGPPSFLPPLDGAMPSLPLDPVSKIQRDEALSYINQYVLPSLSTNSQLERALNANALDADMLRPSENQNWGGWNGQGQSGTQTDGSTGGVPYGGSKTDGILASGLESMTAHFAIGRDAGRGPPLGNVTLLSLPDSEAAMQTAKKETDKLEKSLNQLLKKNRRLLLGAGH